MSHLPQRVVAALVAAAALAGPAMAQDVAFWFAAAADPTGTPISSLTIGPVGTSFTISIWYQSPTAVPHNAVNVFLGFDQTDTYGDTATPQDGIISIDNLSTALDGANPDYTIDSPALGGGQPDAPGLRPYGADIPLVTGLGTFATAEEPTLLLNVTLQNAGLTSGSYPLILWDAGDGLDFTSFIIGDLGESRPEASPVLTLLAGGAGVPEPGALPLALLGAAGLAIARRRRRAAS